MGNSADAFRIEYVDIVSKQKNPFKLNGSFPNAIKPMNKVFKPSYYLK